MLFINNINLIALDALDINKITIVSQKNATTSSINDINIIVLDALDINEILVTSSNNLLSDYY